MQPEGKLASSNDFVAAWDKVMSLDRIGLV
jgi:hypothetical protein